MISPHQCALHYTVHTRHLTGCLDRLPRILITLHSDMIVCYGPHYVRHCVHTLIFFVPCSNSHGHISYTLSTSFSKTAFLIDRVELHGSPIHQVPDMGRYARSLRRADTCNLAITTIPPKTVCQVPGFTDDNCSGYHSLSLPRIANYPPTDNNDSHVSARSHELLADAGPLWPRRLTLMPRHYIT